MGIIKLAIKRLANIYFICFDVCKPLSNFNMLANMIFLLLGYLLPIVVNTEKVYFNVMNETLSRCSTYGTAMTGWTRDGRCVDYGNDSGSHHICIDLKSTDPNFCEQTGQPNWCSEQGECDIGDQTKVAEKTLCDREHWCVCQWAFAKYVQAQTCQNIQEVICDATNMEALKAYETNLVKIKAAIVAKEAPAGSDKELEDALSCLKEKCAIS